MSPLFSSHASNWHASYVTNVRISCVYVISCVSDKLYSDVLSLWPHSVRVLYVRNTCVCAIQCCSYLFVACSLQCFSLIYSHLSSKCATATGCNDYCCSFLRPDVTNTNTILCFTTLLLLLKLFKEKICTQESKRRAEKNRCEQKGRKIQCLAKIIIISNHRICWIVLQIDNL